MLYWCIFSVNRYGYGKNGCTSENGTCWCCFWRSEAHIEDELEDKRDTIGQKDRRWRFFATSLVGLLLQQVRYPYNCTKPHISFVTSSSCMGMSSRVCVRACECVLLLPLFTPFFLYMCVSARVYVCLSRYILHVQTLHGSHRVGWRFCCGSFLPALGRSSSGTRCRQRTKQRRLPTAEVLPISHLRSASLLFFRYLLSCLGCWSFVLLVACVCACLPASC